MPTPLRIWLARNVPALAHLGPRINRVEQPRPGTVTFVAEMQVTGPVRPEAGRHWLELEDETLEVYGGRVGADAGQAAGTTARL